MSTITTSMDPVWLPLALFWLMLAVSGVVRFRKTKSRSSLVLVAGSLVAAAALLFMALQTRPQIDLVNGGKEPILVTVEGEFEMEKLVPTQGYSTRYDLGAELTIMRVTDAGPAESRSFPLPEGKNKQIFKAVIRTTPDGTIQLEFDSPN